MPITSCLRVLRTVVVDSSLGHEPASAVNIIVWVVWHHGGDLLMLSCCFPVLSSSSHLSFSCISLSLGEPAAQEIQKV